MWTEAQKIRVGDLVNEGGGNHNYNHVTFVRHVRDIDHTGFETTVSVTFGSRGGKVYENVKPTERFWKVGDVEVVD
jgi:hypothetical protein